MSDSGNRLAALLVLTATCVVFSATSVHASDFCPAGGNDATEASGDNSESMFSVTGYSFSGEFLIITYNIQYPGMTKVKLFDASQQLLWRNQYVNDQEGEHRLVLRRKALTGGSYIFEFDYKNQKKTLNISV